MRQNAALCGNGLINEKKHVSNVLATFVPDRVFLVFYLDFYRKFHHSVTFRFVSVKVCHAVAIVFSKNPVMVQFLKVPLNGN